MINNSFYWNWWLSAVIMSEAYWEVENLYFSSCFTFISFIPGSLTRPTLDSRAILSSVCWAIMCFRTRTGRSATGPGCWSTVRNIRPKGRPWRGRNFWRRARGGASSSHSNREHLTLKYWINRRACPARVDRKKTFARSCGRTHPIMQRISFWLNLLVAAALLQIYLMKCAIVYRTFY